MVIMVQMMGPKPRYILVLILMTVKSDALSHPKPAEILWVMFLGT